MTPFGQRMRQLRAERKVSLKTMADEIGVSSSYLSALEHGRRGTPSWLTLQRIIAYFNVIWDDAEELQRLAERSHPRVVVDTAGLDPAATELAHLIADKIGRLGPKSLRDIKKAVLDAARRDGAA
ncbi:helix-turn-helix transcriptional regulator [Kaistia dalseonensis]|uniref:Transcriptional regulator with XRE-family HTH domain n=1 Tax=Kaistia dalseonensis TaxID=410840 RepID=A0ABU0H562_9HYPH|nr:helix-turn-helix transcriptional regulator [Kaistia dalseonensis]MCX5494849.1 helix-turn-helix transcriptional regulator [Kaistia dalseonensis]MDQ0437430.1 transcriptional regulator with XRE-family HTH domain [Kaistia dalseonensis]